MRYRIKVGDEGRFHIRDHAMSRESGIPDPDESLGFHVYGKVIHVQGHSVTVCPWVADVSDPDQNTEWFALVTGAILGFRPLSRRDRR